MKILTKTENISKALLFYLQQVLSCSSLKYRSPLNFLAIGSEAFIYRFQLQCSIAKMSEPMILRLYKGNTNLDQAKIEGIVQNAVADAGYPAPPVFFTSSDRSILGNEFLLMKKMPGAHSIASITNLPYLLGCSHADLHHVDSKPLQKALQEQNVDKHCYTLEGILNWLNSFIKAKQYTWLNPSLKWLKENMPEIESSVICHGDFHPLNILCSDGKISGVLDWSGFKLSDPALDVAFTKINGIFAGPIYFPKINWQKSIDQYLDVYQKHFQINMESLSYFETLRYHIACIEAINEQGIWNNQKVFSKLLNSIFVNTGNKLKPQ